MTSRKTRNDEAISSVANVMSSFGKEKNLEPHGLSFSLFFYVDQSLFS